MNTTSSGEKPKKVKAIVIFQGGAALAAYECGAFQAIATEMDNNHEELAVVGGTSSGGLNAAIIAKSYKEHQGIRTGAATAAAKDLKTFWTTALPNPSPSFFPPYPGLQFPLADITLRFLNLGLLLLRGNPHMFTLDLPTLLNPLAPAHYNGRAAEKLLEEHFGTYEGCDPRLIIAATNVQSGNMETFDSGKEEITPTMILAGGSFPGLVPATQVDGEYYWDGGAWTTTPLGAIMNTLMSSSEEHMPTYKVYLVNDHPQQAPLPQDIIAVSERMWDLLVGDKTVYDIKLSERLNKYIEMVQFLKQYFDTLPEEVRQKIGPAYREVKRRYREITGEKKWAILHFVHLERGSLPSDFLATEWDFSLSRIEELIAQGKRETQKQLEDHESLQEECKARITRLQEEYDILEQELSSLQVVSST